MFAPWFAFAGRWIESWSPEIYFLDEVTMRKYADKATKIDAKKILLML